MKRILVVLIIFFGLALTSCGGGGASTTISVALGDFQFTPNFFTIPAGEEITVNATNNGAVVHNFVVMKLGAEAGAEFNDEDTPNIYWQVQLEPGGSTTATFTAPPDAGEYQIVCSTSGHLMAGMIAKLVVVAGE